MSTGSNELCLKTCSGQNSLHQLGENLQRALDVLMQLPNILIAVVSPPDPSMIQSALHRPVTCQVLTRSLCPCVAANNAKSRTEFLQDLESVRSTILRVIASPLYHDNMNAGL